MQPPPAKLNLGCGKKKLPGCVNVDRVPEVEPDLVHDLNHYPYPFADNRFQEVHAYDLVEHLEDLPAFMREVWRISLPQARLFITTPHFSCANSFTDPTHRRHLGCFSLDYFTAGHQWNFYGSAGFIIRQRLLVFTPSLLNKVVHRLANRYPAAYESRWAWLFPAWYLYFELEVCKQTTAAQAP